MIRSKFSNLTNEKKYKIFWQRKYIWMSPGIFNCLISSFQVKFVFDLFHAFSHRFSSQIFCSTLYWTWRHRRISERLSLFETFRLGNGTSSRKSAKTWDSLKIRNYPLKVYSSVSSISYFIVSSCCLSSCFNNFLPNYYFVCKQCLREIKKLLVRIRAMNLNKWMQTKIKLRKN